MFRRDGLINVRPDQSQLAEYNLLVHTEKQNLIVMKRK